MKYDPKVSKHRSAFIQHIMSLHNDNSGFFNCYWKKDGMCEIGIPGPAEQWTFVLQRLYSLQSLKPDDEKIKAAIASIVPQIPPNKKTAEQNLKIFKTHLPINLDSFNKEFSFASQPNVDWVLHGKDKLYSNEQLARKIPANALSEYGGLKYSTPGKPLDVTAKPHFEDLPEMVWHIMISCKFSFKCTPSLSAEPRGYVPNDRMDSFPLTFSASIEAPGFVEVGPYKGEVKKKYDEYIEHCNAEIIKINKECDENQIKEERRLKRKQVLTEETKVEDVKKAKIEESQQ